MGGWTPGDAGAATAATREDHHPAERRVRDDTLRPYVTYAPTICGLATFTAALAAELSKGAADTATVVRVLDTTEPQSWSTHHRSPVSVEFHSGRPEGVDAAIAALDACDVAIVQHEYGIYAGPDGDEIVPLLQRLSVPVIVVLHTVLAAPTASQRAVLEAVCAASVSVVVMSDNAAAVLTSGYRVDAAKVSVIPHGVSAQAPAGRVHGSERQARRDVGPDVGGQGAGVGHPRDRASAGSADPGGVRDLGPDPPQGAREGG